MDFRYTQYFSNYLIVPSNVHIQYDLWRGVKSCWRGVKSCWTKINIVYSNKHCLLRSRNGFSFIGIFISKGSAPMCESQYWIMLNKNNYFIFNKIVNIMDKIILQIFWSLLVELSSHWEQCAHLIQFKCTRYSHNDLTLNRLNKHTIISDSIVQPVDQCSPFHEQNNMCAVIRTGKHICMCDSHTWFESLWPALLLRCLVIY